MYKELQYKGEGQASEIAQLVRQWADRGNMSGREGRVSWETAVQICLEPWVSHLFSLPG
jgi:hypothetical protein